MGMTTDTRSATCLLILTSFVLPFQSVLARPSKEVVDCRCEYPDEQWYDYFDLEELKQSDYMIVRGDVVLPRKHYACKDVRFVCPWEEYRYPPWEYQCMKDKTDDDDPGKSLFSLLADSSTMLSGSIRDESDQSTKSGLLDTKTRFQGLGFEGASATQSDFAQYGGLVTRSFRGESIKDGSKMRLLRSSLRERYHVPVATPGDTNVHGIFDTSSSKQRKKNGNVKHKWSSDMEKGRGKDSNKIRTGPKAVVLPSDHPTCQNIAPQPSVPFPIAPTPTSINPPAITTPSATNAPIVTDVPTSNIVAVPEVPSDLPSTPPSNEPSSRPVSPTVEPSSFLINRQPSLQPANVRPAPVTVGPTISPTNRPTVAHSDEPTEDTDSVPTPSPSDSQTETPSDEKTKGTSVAPSDDPTLGSSSEPTIAFSDEPTIVSYDDLSTHPSRYPSEAPSNVLTLTPSGDSTIVPSLLPSHGPTSMPSDDATFEPTENAVVQQDLVLTTSPFRSPTSIAPTISSPTSQPVQNPTLGPTEIPTAFLTFTVTAGPTTTTSIAPTPAQSVSSAPSKAVALTDSALSPSPTSTNRPTNTFRPTATWFPTTTHWPSVTGFPTITGFPTQDNESGTRKPE